MAAEPLADRFRRFGRELAKPACTVQLPPCALAETALLPPRALADRSRPPRQGELSCCEQEAAEHECGHATVALTRPFGCGGVCLEHVRQYDANGNAIATATRGWAVVQEPQGFGLERDFRGIAAAHAAGHAATLLFNRNAEARATAEAWAAAMFRDLDDDALRGVVADAVGEADLEQQLPLWRERAMYDATETLKENETIYQRLVVALLKLRNLTASDLQKIIGADRVLVTAHLRPAQRCNYELYRGLNKMIWTLAPFAYVAHASEGASDDVNHKFVSLADDGVFTFPSPVADFGTALSLAYGRFKDGNNGDATWQSDVASWEPSYLGSVQDPDTVTSGVPFSLALFPAAVSRSGGSDAGNVGQVQAGGQYFYGRGVPTAGEKYFNTKVEFFCWPQVDEFDVAPGLQVPPGAGEPYNALDVTFDSDAVGGDFTWHNWKRVESISITPADAAAPIYTDKIGPDVSSTAPSADDPPYPGDYIAGSEGDAATATKRGLYLADQTMIIKFNVPGGMVYVDTQA